MFHRDSFSPRQKTLFICGGLLALVVAAFWRVLFCDFLIYDDWEYVVTNDMVRRGVSAESVGWAFTKFHSSNWHPLTWISHMADVQMYGLRPWGHHLTNLLLHLTNTLLVFGLLRQLTGALWRSALVAALFALHPTHVESVAWVAERKDVLSTCFGLLSLLAYARYARTAILHPPSSILAPWRSPMYWLTFALLACGLMSKPMLVTWPCVMLLIDMWPMRRFSPPSSIFHLPSSRRLVLEKLPFFALTIGSCVLTFFAQRAGGAVQSMEQLSLATRLGNTAISYLRYLGKTFWPTDLSIYYPYPAAWPAWLIGSAVVILAALTVGAWLNRTARPYLLVGWLWFLGTLVPVIGLVQVGGQAIADRYQYIPQLGLFIALVWLAGDWVQRRAPGPWGAICAAAMIVLTCGALTWHRLKDWKNSETLFTQALRVTEGNYIAHNNLGLHYLSVKRYDLAIPCFEAALALRPAFAATHSNLGLALAAQKQVPQAIAHLQEALRLQPGFFEAQVNLANLLVPQNRLTEALALLEEAVRLAPQYPEAQYSLANVLAELGRLEEAARHARQALQLRPDYVAALNCLGTIFLKQGQLDEAARQYRAALALKPDFAEAQCNLGLIAATQGKLAESIAQYEAALRLNPELLSARYGLALVFEQSGRLTESIEQWQAALQSAPETGGAHEQLARLLMLQGRSAEALPHLATVVKQQPDNATVRGQYAMALDQTGDTSQAVTEYRRALELNARQPELLNNLSWILAANPDPSRRNGAEAVQHGEAACRLTEHREAGYLGTLAAAYAEAGRFDEAVATAQKAVDLAKAAGQPDLAARNAELLELYRARKPYHEPAR
jgi:tetratricopeptide (TPR) repeat protein